MNINDPVLRRYNNTLLRGKVVGFCSIKRVAMVEIEIENGVVIISDIAHVEVEHDTTARKRG